MNKRLKRDIQVMNERTHIAFSNTQRWYGTKLCESVKRKVTFILKERDLYIIGIPAHVNSRSAVFGDFCFAGIRERAESHVE